MEALPPFRAFQATDGFEAIARGGMAAWNV